jgi:hypothetical protein
VGEFLTMFHEFDGQHKILEDILNSSSGGFFK